jgi:hypothetical protein
MSAIILFDQRGDLFLGEVAHHLLDHFVLVVESEVHRVQPPSSIEIGGESTKD